MAKRKKTPPTFGTVHLEHNSYGYRENKGAHAVYVQHGKHRVELRWDEVQQMFALRSIEGRLHLHPNVSNDIGITIGEF